MEGQDSIKYIKKRKISQPNSSQEEFNECITDKSDLLRESGKATYFSYNPHELDSILNSSSKTKTTYDEYFGADPQDLDKMLQKSRVHPDYREKAKELQEQIKERERLSQAIATENYYRRYNLPKPKVTVRNSPSRLKNKSPPIPNNSQNPNENPKEYKNLSEGKRPNNKPNPKEKSKPDIALHIFNPLSNEVILPILEKEKMQLPKSIEKSIKEKVIPFVPNNKIIAYNHDREEKLVPDYRISKNEQKFINKIFQEKIPSNCWTLYPEKVEHGKIYAITNLVNNKIYIGQTQRKISTRFDEHISDGISNRRDTHLYNAIRKYGKENFFIQKIHDIKDCNAFTLDRLESYYILKYNTLNKNLGYNLSLDVRGGYKTQEQRNQHSNILKNKTKTQQNEQNIEKKPKKKKTAHPQTQESRDRIRKTRLKRGVIITAESLEKEHETKYNNFLKKHFHLDNTSPLAFKNSKDELVNDFRGSIKDGYELKDLEKHFNIPDHAVRNFICWIYGHRSIKKARDKEKKRL